MLPRRLRAEQLTTPTLRMTKPKPTAASSRIEWILASLPPSSSAILPHLQLLLLHRHLVHDVLLQRLVGLRLSSAVGRKRREDPVEPQQRPPGGGGRGARKALGEQPVGRVLELHADLWEERESGGMSVGGEGIPKNSLAPHLCCTDDRRPLGWGI
jgi:hypothetical protein